MSKSRRRLLLRNGKRPMRAIRDHLWLLIFFRQWFTVIEAIAIRRHHDYDMRNLGLASQGIVQRGVANFR